MVPQLNQESNQELNFDRFKSMEDIDVIPNGNIWIITAGWVMIFSVIAIFGVASQTQYKVTVQAPATILPAGKNRIIQSHIEGKVINIYVKEGDFVNKGDLVASLDTKYLNSKIGQIIGDMDKTKLRLTQVNFQINENERQILAQKKQNNSTFKSAQSELEIKQLTYTNRKIITLSEVEKATANVNQSKERIQEAYMNLKSAQSELHKKELELETLLGQLARLQSLNVEGGFPLKELENLKLKVATGKEEVAIAKTTMYSRQELIEARKEQLKAVEAELRKVKAQLNFSPAEITIALQKIEQIKADGEETIARLQQEKQSLIEKGHEISKEINTKKKELDQVKIEIEKTNLVATEDGYIFRLNLKNIGQNIRRSEEIAQIVPSSAPLEISAAVKTQDISKVKVGQQVDMRVSSCVYTDYGTLKGKVKQISSNTIKPQKNVQNNGISNNKNNTANAFYEITIEPSTLILKRTEKNQCKLQIGMEGRADIIHKEETLLKFLLRKAKLMTDV